jgi:hypothetical protein
VRARLDFGGLFPHISHAELPAVFEKVHWVQVHSPDTAIALAAFAFAGFLIASADAFVTVDFDAAFVAGVFTGFVGAGRQLGKT